MTLRLDGRQVNGKMWFFYESTTDVNFGIRVTVR
jgi:hypothetical protein